MNSRVYYKVLDIRNINKMPHTFYEDQFLGLMFKIQKLLWIA